MANKIVLKKSSVAGKVPQLGDLDWGEVALNYADGKLYFKRATNVIDSFSTQTGGGGTPVETSTTYTTTTVSQEVIDSISASSYRSGKYEIQLTSPIGFERVELTFIHNGTNVFTGVSGISSTSQSLGTFSSNIVNGNVQVIFVANNVDTTLVFTKKLTAPAGTTPGQSTTIPEDLSAGSGEIDLQAGDGEIDLNGGTTPSNPSTPPEDLDTGSAIIDLESGSGELDLNGGTESVIVPQDLSSGNATIDLTSGSGETDLTL